MIMVNITTLFFMREFQGAIKMIKYSEDLCAMQTAVEEVHSGRYMLHCIGVKVKYASFICGDNIGVIQNIAISDSLLKINMFLLTITVQETQPQQSLCIQPKYW